MKPGCRIIGCDGTRHIETCHCPNSRSDRDPSTTYPVVPWWTAFGSQSQWLGNFLPCCVCWSSSPFLLLKPAVSVSCSSPSHLSISFRLQATRARSSGARVLILIAFLLALLLASLRLDSFLFGQQHIRILQVQSHSFVPLFAPPTLFCSKLCRSFISSNLVFLTQSNYPTATTAYLSVEMKYFHVSAVLLAFASLSSAQDIAQVAPDGAVFYTAPAGPAPTTQSPPIVEEKVYVAPSSNPNQAPSGFTAPPPPPPSSSPAAPAPSSPATGGGGSGQSGKGTICINFSGDFYFANAGSWGTKSGQGAAAASQCFGMVPGGAMFICESECNASGDAAPAKYTKLECNFEGEYPNCDISLVDGYSLPLECTIPGAAPSKIGGLTDLNTLTSCPTTGGDNTCQNAQGYNGGGSATAPPVSPFFLHANTNNPDQPGPGGNYCVWQTCSGPSDAFWNSATNPTISCQVGTKTANKKRADGEIQSRNVSEVEAREVESDLQAHMRRHVGGAHSHAMAHVRSLKAVIA